MLRTLPLITAFTLGLAACAPSLPQSTGPQLGPDGQPLPQVYRISAFDQSRIEYRMLDAVNALRQDQGLAPLTLNASLRAAAATHARDMSVQNRPWHFGSDGSSPVDRVRRAGYGGELVGEAISETYETELETLAAWMREEGTSDIILSREARDMGFSWYQENNGKIWWTLITGAPRGGAGFEVAAN